MLLISDNQIYELIQSKFVFKFCEAFSKYLLFRHYTLSTLFTNTNLSKSKIEIHKFQERKLKSDSVLNNKCTIYWIRTE